jgi:hypothetical protein
VKPAVVRQNPIGITFYADGGKDGQAGLSKLLMKRLLKALAIDDPLIRPDHCLSKHSHLDYLSSCAGHLAQR